jgi:thioredoxin reductase (NADPH)
LVIPFRAACKTRVIEVPRLEMLRLMPELADIVITLLAARRRTHIEFRESALLLIGDDIAPEVRRIADFANRNKVPYTSLALGSPEADAVADGCSLPPRTSAVVCGREAIDEPKQESAVRPARQAASRIT